MTKDSSKNTDESLTDSDDHFKAWIIVALERIYDLLLVDLYHRYGEEQVKSILEAHAKHDYMFPEPSGDEE